MANLVVVLSLVALTVVYASRVVGWINQYEARGLRVDNDLGQRGLAIIGLFSFLLIGLAFLSWLNLRLFKPIGFLLQSLVWLFVLVGAGMGWMSGAWGGMAPTVKTWIQIICLVGITLDLVMFTASKVYLKNRVLSG
ncbi:hypothetical protein GC088_12570 [Arthrobacter sp. JZ12]|uniref:hypothetical protein n=1 Tax=Arthrobacter sp. JZ12 TaxID=2654190 RepID=UPI002B4628B0|nr:hypothetical protein [Arthrobacter sp. JZ12]WRH25821.1 hypothetical protein GC088_12570 [Arthrobacter sp. JZ12]